MITVERSQEEKKWEKIKLITIFLHFSRTQGWLTRFSRTDKRLLSQRLAEIISPTPQQRIHTPERSSSHSSERIKCFQRCSTEDIFICFTASTLSLGFTKRKCFMMSNTFSTHFTAALLTCGKVWTCCCCFPSKNFKLEESHCDFSRGKYWKHRVDVHVNEIFLLWKVALHWRQPDSRYGKAPYATWTWRKVMTSS